MTAAPSRPAVRGTAARAIDVTALAALFALAAVGFWPVYGGPVVLVTVLAALAFALLIALAGARWSWGPLRIFAAVVVVHLVLGTPFAAPARGLWGILPTPGSLLELLTAPVTAWKVTLTMAPPVGVAEGVLVVAWLPTLLLALGAFTIVLRTRRYVPAWLLTAVLLAVTIVFGTREGTLTLVRGILLAAVSIAWLCWRYESDRLAGAHSTIISDTVRPGSWRNPVLRRRVVGGALIVVLAACAAVAARPLLDVPEGRARYALRDQIVPPFDPRDETSPLAQFRGYLKNQGSDTLFTVSGLSEGDRVSIAVLDDYDREVYLVVGGSDKDSASGAFLRTAADVDYAGPYPGERTATFTIGDYDRIWMPTTGSRTTRISPGGHDPAAIAESLYVNQSTQTLVDADGLRSGDAYAVTYVPYRDPTPAQQKALRFGDVDLPSIPPMDPELRARALEMMGDARTDYGRMQNLTASLKDQTFFTHGLEGDTPSWPGHGEYRLLSMLQEPGIDTEDSAASPTGMIGDQEQLAALEALMARSTGIPARVVMGFTVPGGGTGPVAVTGEDVTAWVEVYFDGVGWVRFDPTPEDDKDPTQPEKTIVDQPKPQVAQPPPPPVEPPRLPPAMTGETGDRSPEDAEPTPTWVLATVGAASPFVLLAVLAGAVVALKALRRRRRRRRGEPDQRILAGWTEVLDTARDLGRAPPTRRTRRETARALAADFPGTDLEALAVRADRGVFGPESMAPQAVEQYWDQVIASRRTMTRTASRWRALRAAVSLRSLVPGRHRRRARTRGGKGRRRR
ncbi:transglutaminase domain-containing protein [Brachybacterium huguangmaarense]|uniref:Transglutaminase domain-containing protein n=1 Tax=Brachybacterium huguangmaarense TaxID=1652028 RepID=A0ABY6FZ07_9MICO|nr:transglutaminase domain-containing protein [Brachybacterium huguangmaarense]UYG15616.1 transglutaminase domain-containing protein [Brachybacterium huguangmaarense]